MAGLYNSVVVNAAGVYEKISTVEQCSFYVQLDITQLKTINNQYEVWSISAMATHVNAIMDGGVVMDVATYPYFSADAILSHHTEGYFYFEADTISQFLAGGQ